MSPTASAWSPRAATSETIPTEHRPGTVSGTPRGQDGAVEVFGQVGPAVTLAQPTAETAEVPPVSGELDAPGHFQRLVKDLRGVPASNLEAEATQAVFPDLLLDHSRRCGPTTGAVILTETHEVLAFAVGLTDHAIGDPNPVDPGDESPPLIENFDLRCRQIDPQTVQLDERVGLEPGLTPRIDEPRSSNGSRTAVPPSLSVDDAPHIPRCRGAEADAWSATATPFAGVHRPQAVGHGPRRCEDPKAPDLDHLVDDRVAVVKHPFGQPAGPGLDCQLRSGARACRGEAGLESPSPMRRSDG
jgi:hypothetical protein